MSYYLAVISQTEFEGLHSPAKSKRVSVKFNGNLIDQFTLPKSKQPPHDDYFHLPRPAPVEVLKWVNERMNHSNPCNVYWWFVDDNCIEPDVQRVVLEVESEVLWDIDRVGICCVTPSGFPLKVRAWAVEIAAKEVLKRLVGIIGAALVLILTYLIIRIVNLI